MKKIISKSINLILTNIKFLLIKFRHTNKFHYEFLNFVSPFVRLEIDKGATLSIGKKVQIRRGSKIQIRSNAKLIIGKNVFMNFGCMVIGHEEIIIGDNVQFGPNVLIYDHDHDFRTKGGLRALKYKTSPVKIGENVWIGANSVILRGTVIGDNSIIGAGSVIKGNFPSNSVITQKRETNVMEYDLNE